MRIIYSPQLFLEMYEFMEKTNPPRYGTDELEISSDDSNESDKE